MVDGSTTWSTNVVRGASIPRSQSHASEQGVLTLLRAFGFEICKYDPFTRFDVANASPGFLLIVRDGIARARLESAQFPCGYPKGI
jgi:hypothetical protein